MALSHAKSGNAILNVMNVFMEFGSSAWYAFADKFCEFHSLLNPNDEFIVKYLKRWAKIKCYWYSLRSAVLWLLDVVGIFNKNILLTKLY